MHEPESRRLSGLHHRNHGEVTPAQHPADGTKLAPKKLAGQMMGAWFLATSLGTMMPGQFLQMVILPAGVAIVIIALRRPIRKMMGGVY